MSLVHDSGKGLQGRPGSLPCSKSKLGTAAPPAVAENKREGECDSKIMDMTDIHN